MHMGTYMQFRWPYVQFIVSSLFWSVFFLFENTLLKFCKRRTVSWSSYLLQFHINAYTCELNHHVQPSAVLSAHKCIHKCIMVSCAASPAILHTVTTEISFELLTAQTGLDACSRIPFNQKNEHHPVFSISGGWVIAKELSATYGRWNRSSAASHHGQGGGMRSGSDNATLLLQAWLPKC